MFILYSIHASFVRDPWNWEIVVVPILLFSAMLWELTIKPRFFSKSRG